MDSCDCESNKQAGSLLWWVSPQRVNKARVRRMCRICGITLLVATVDPLSRTSVIGAIRKVFPKSNTVVVTDTKRYRRYQVFKPVETKGMQSFDTVEFVRVFSNGNVICELDRENERLLVNALRTRADYIPAKTLNVALHKYLVKYVGAIPVGDVYFIAPTDYAELRRVVRFLRKLLGKTHTGGFTSSVYCLVLHRNNATVKLLERGISAYMAEELSHILQEGLSKGIHKAATRRKQKLKRRVKAVERAIGRPLYGFRSILANTVMDYPEIQDRDERKQWF